MSVVKKFKIIQTEKCDHPQFFREGHCNYASVAWENVCSVYAGEFSTIGLLLVYLADELETYYEHNLISCGGGG